MRSLVTYIVLTTILTGCIETQSSKGYKKITLDNYRPPEKDVEVDSNTVFSIFKTPLPAKKLSGETKNETLAKLEKAKAQYEQQPDNINYIIEYCKALSVLGWYYEAITVYSDGLALRPSAYELLMMRGQAYIILRQFDLALEDLQRAAFYSRPASNKETFGDALTNFYKNAKSNEKFNIYFSLGFVNYLKGNYDKTISSFKQCMKYADNNDLLIFITDWFYLTYRRLGNTKAADELLLNIGRATRAKNFIDYYNRVMLYKGVFKAHNLMSYAENDDNNSLSPILSYGIGTWHLINGDKIKAVKIYERILLSDAWDSYEYIASEVELKNLQPN